MLRTCTTMRKSEHLQQAASLVLQAVVSLLFIIPTVSSAESAPNSNKPCVNKNAIPIKTTITITQEELRRAGNLPQKWSNLTPQTVAELQSATEDVNKYIDQANQETGCVSISTHRTLSITYHILNDLNELVSAFAPLRNPNLHPAGMGEPIQKAIDNKVWYYLHSIREIIKQKWPSTGLPLLQKDTNDLIDQISSSYDKTGIDTQFQALDQIIQGADTVGQQLKSWVGEMIAFYHDGYQARVEWQQNEIYLHPDGGMVRVKPEGDPLDEFRPQPHASKSVLFDATQEPRSNNEAFKVTSDGRAVPKGLQRFSGLHAPAVIRDNKVSLKGFKDYVMAQVHTNVERP